MSSEWLRLSVAELQASGYLLVEDGNHGEYRPRPHEFVASGVSFIRAADMADGRVLFDSSASISSVADARIRKGRGRAGDVLLSHKGTVGKVALVPNGCPSYVCSPQTTFWRVLDEDVIDRRYLFAYLQSKDFKNQLASRKGETDMADYVSLTAQRQLTVPLPHIDVQRAIGAQSSMLFDRITLLRDTNATLEAIAQALFTSWFVDFDPVRAKMAGRAPEGMDEATAALFPDALEETELGWVPKGWQFGAVGDIARLKKGTVNPGSQPDAMFEHFSLPAFDNGCRPVVELGGAIKSNKTPVPSDAVLLSKLNPHIPRVWLPVSCGSNAVCSTEFLVFQPVGVGSKELIYCTFRSPDFIARLQRLVTGTSNSHQRIKPDQVELMSCVVPPKDIASQFELSMRPIFERVHANREQAQTLASLRDALLPRLISGQLRLPEASSHLEELA